MEPRSVSSTNDAVFARLGGGRTTAVFLRRLGVLLDAQGRGQVASVDEINGGTCCG